MKKKSDLNFFILIAVFVILVVLAIFFFVTQKESIKEKRDEFKDKADELKRKIIEKEDVISSLVLQLECVKCLDDFLVAQAKRMFKVAKLLFFMLIAGISFIAYAIFNLEFWQCILSIISVIGLLYNTSTIYFKNKLGDFNQTLKLLQEYFTLKVYRKYGFQPEAIVELEYQLITERGELERLKQDYNRFHRQIEN